MMEKVNVVISTDGSCKGNPGPGGYYSILRFGKLTKVICGNSKRTSNNRMELTAVIKATNALKRPCNVTLRCDSKYVLDGIVRLESMEKSNWKKKTGARYENVELWQELSDVIKKGDHSFSCIYVPGHSGDADNEACDKGAKEQAEIARREE